MHHHNSFFAHDDDSRMGGMDWTGLEWNRSGYQSLCFDGHQQNATAEQTAIF